MREAVLAAMFGAGAHADVFRVALRGPNLLQNLLGEQTLSASFIPVYSRLLAQGRTKDAARFAGAIFGLLLAAGGGLALLGMVFAAPIVALVSSGYLADAAAVAAGVAEVDRYPIAVRAVRILFPMTGVLVLSAWALGVLNSHRRFLLPYLAPAVWNAAIVGSVLFFARGLPGDGPMSVEALDGLLSAACWGALVGGVLQFLVQLPAVLGVLDGFRPTLSTRAVGVGEALSSFAPLAAGRGAVQLSSYLDLWLSSFLMAGAQAALGWAQVLHLLPVALFGLSVAAAELPELSADAAGRAARVRASVRQTAFLTIPTFVGYLLFGRLLVSALYERGSFGAADGWLVTLTLGAYALGLPASNTSRALTNVFYATGRTGIPARVAVERVVLSAAIGAVLMLRFDGIPVARYFPDATNRVLFLGAVGLAIGSAVSSWYELVRLRLKLGAVVEGVRLPVKAVGSMLLLAVVAAIPPLGVRLWLDRNGIELPAWAEAAVVVALFASVYLGFAASRGWPEWRSWVGRRRAGIQEGGER